MQTTEKKQKDKLLEEIEKSGDYGLAATISEMPKGSLERVEFLKRVFKRAVADANDDVCSRLLDFLEIAICDVSVIFDQNYISLFMEWFIPLDASKLSPDKAKECFREPGNLATRGKDFSRTKKKVLEIVASGLFLGNDEGFSDKVLLFFAAIPCNGGLNERLCDEVLKEFINKYVVHEGVCSSNLIRMHRYLLLLEKEIPVLFLTESNCAHRVFHVLWMGYVRQLRRDRVFSILKALPAETLDQDRGVDAIIQNSTIIADLIRKAPDSKVLSRVSSRGLSSFRYHVVSAQSVAFYSFVERSTGKGAIEKQLDYLSEVATQWDKEHPGYEVKIRLIWLSVIGLIPEQADLFLPHNIAGERVISIYRPPLPA